MKSINRLFKGLMALILLAFMLGCEKEGFEYQMSDIKIDSISFSAGSSSLIADGQAALSFIIQAYSKKQLTVNGVVKDSMLLIPSDRIPDTDKKVFDESGKEVGLEFTTTLTTPATKSFYAKIGEKQSMLKHVSIQAPGAANSKIIVPVVVHVFELKKNDPKRYPWYVEVDYKKLQDLVDGMNVMFNRIGTSAPNGTSSNIEFVLAAMGPDGKPLEKPGYNTFEYVGTMNWGFGTTEASK
jgi:hypothetical protein